MTNCLLSRQFNLQMALLTCFVSFVVLLISLTAGECERIKDKMYESLGGVFCFRRLNATKQYGCSSSLTGDTGVLHFIESLKDVDWIVSSGNADPYVPVVTLENFTRSSMLKLRNSKKVSGLILWKNGTLDSYSTEDTCPNRYSGIPNEACSNKDAWNSVGNSLFFEDWGFPIAYVEKETIGKLHDCFLKHNADLIDQHKRPLCAVQLQSHMLAAVDTRTCIRRSKMINNLTPVKYCDALGDYNVYLLTNSTTTNKERSVIVLSARQDGATMFDGLAPGAMNPITSIVTLLTVSSYLKDMKIFSKPPEKNLLMILFNGEAFDYIGSSRVVYDIEQGNFPTKEEPLTLSQIGLFVELDQISGDNLYHHGNSIHTPLAQNFVESLAEELSNNSIKFNASTGKLPPSSVQRFLLADPSIPSLVLTNYDSSYKNSFYNSIMDDASSLGYKYGNGSIPSSDIQSKIDLIAKSIAKSLYKVLNNETYQDGDLTSKIKMVDELFHCYLETQNCSIFRNVSNGAALPDVPAPVYVGVHGNNNTITKLTGLTMSYLTGTQLSSNNSECLNRTKPGMHYIWINNKCIETSVSYWVAHSPAFEIENYNWTSNNYSSWTESVWRELGMRIFLKPSWRHEILNISTGLLVLVLSFVVVYFVNFKADVLFNRVVLRSSEGAW